MSLRGPQGCSKSALVFSPNWPSTRMLSVKGCHTQGTSWFSSPSHEAAMRRKIGSPNVKSSTLGRQQAISKCEEWFFHSSSHKKDKSLSQLNHRFLTSPVLPRVYPKSHPTMLRTKSSLPEIFIKHPPMQIPPDLCSILLQAGSELLLPFLSTRNFQDVGYWW